MGTVALSLALIPVEAMLVAHDRRGWLVMTAYWLAGGAGVVAGYVWLSRWPTKRQSVVLAIMGSVTMALWALLQFDPLLSLLAGASLVISGAYFALFHTPRHVLGNIVAATVVAGVASQRLWRTGVHVHAALSLWLVFALNVVGPLAVLLLIDAFGADLPQTFRDPLTGLLNRRGLRLAASAAVGAADPRDCLRVTVIDIDDFKRINDTYGHSAGDATLWEIAEILRANVHQAALACRSGGEEFVVIDTSASDDPPRYAELIRSQIATLPFAVTASIGTFRARVCSDGVEQIDRAISAADDAMYTAKRLGGDRVRHTP